jgi:excisionase family DNA binding protein
MSVVSEIVRELRDDKVALAELAACLEPLLATVNPPSAADREPEPDRWSEWMSTREAARYVGQSVPALQRLAKRGAIPSRQEHEGCKRYFYRADLDAYRRGQPSLRPVQVRHSGHA